MHTCCTSRNTKWLTPYENATKKQNAYFIHYTYCRGHNMYNFCPTRLQRTELKCTGSKENNSSIWVARKFTRVLLLHHVGTMSRSQRLDLRGKAGHPVARESPLFLLVSDFRESPFEPPNQAILFTYDKWLDIEIIAKVGFPIPMRLRRNSLIFIIFLAVQDSSIGDLVTQRFLIVDTSRH